MLGVVNLDKPVGPTSHDMVGLLRRLRKPRLDLVGQRKQPFHSAHDFLLFGERRQHEGQLSDSLAVQCLWA